MPIDVNVQNEEIQVSTSGQTVSATVSGGQGPQGPSGAVAASAPVTYNAATQTVGLSVGAGLATSAGSLVLASHTHAIADVTGLQTALDAKLPLAGGAMNANAVVTFSDGTNESEVGGWGFGVQLTADNAQYAALGPTSISIHGAPGATTITPGGITLANATQIVVGSFDNATGGANGIGLICAVGYELNWQGGRLRSVSVGGDGTPLPLFLDSQLVVPAAGIQFAGDSTVQTTAWTGSLSWEDLGGVPAEFPPAAHTHTIANVTGLQTALNGKQAAGSYAAAIHGHVIFDITGLPDVLNAKANLSNPQFTGTVGGITKAMVGLANVPNVDATARANHTGTQTLSTISDAGTAASRSVPAAGDASTTQVVLGSDTRLTNARTPTAHKASHATGGADALSPADIGAAAAAHTHGISDVTGLQTALDGKQAAGSYAAATHSHAAGDITSGTLDVGRIPTGSTSSTVCLGNDARLSDARTPTAHVHAAGDITTGTIATARLASGTANSTTYLRGDQTWATVSGESFHPFLLAGM